jgi:RND family efflux transporter MFP subunit
LDRVTAATPPRKTIRFTTTQPGRIEAFEQTPLLPKIAAYVEEVLVDIGDGVEKNQVLIQLAVPELHDELRHKEALVAQAQAEVHQAAASIAAAEAALATAEAKVTEAKAGTLRAEAEFERWKSESARMSDLVRREAVTPQLADEKLSVLGAAEAARQEAAARVELAEAAVRQSAANIAQARADADAAAARLAVTESDVAQTRTMLAYTQIKAPFAGVVTKRNVDAGHYVQPATSGAEPLLVVVRTDRVRVFIDVPEVQAPLVDPGDPAVVHVQSLGGRAINAAVTRTSWAVDAANRSLNTEIDLDNTDGTLRPGMYATAQVVLQVRESALTLPVTALVTSEGQPCCYCVVSGKLVRTPLTLGLRNGDDVEVVEGLAGDETVVLARAESLRHGQLVEMVAPERH